MNHGDPSKVFRGYDVAGLDGLANFVEGTTFIVGGGIGAAEAGGNFLLRGVSRKIELLEQLSENFASKMSAVIDDAAEVMPTVSKVHGNSLASLRPTWGYKLFSEDGTFLKNGITSRLVPETRYTRAFMSGKYMEAIPFPNRLGAYQWEFQQNEILRGPLNLNMH